MSQLILTNKIMGRIVNFEKARIRQAIFIFCFSGIIFFLGFIGTAFIVNATLERQETLSVLTVWQEDPEIIHDYFAETLDTVWEELPKGEIVIASIFLATTVSILYLFMKRYPELEKNRKSLYAYATKKGEDVGEEARHTQTIYYIIGGVVVLILAFVILVPRMRKSGQTSGGQENSSQGNTAGNNSLTNPTNAPTSLQGKIDGQTPEEKKAVAAFTFTLTSPNDGTHFKTAAISIKGKTVAKADVFVNEVDGKADNDGNFTISYTLEEGDNYLVIGANDEYGNFEEKEIIVYYDVAE